MKDFLNSLQRPVNKVVVVVVCFVLFFLTKLCYLEIFDLSPNSKQYISNFILVTQVLLRRSKMAGTPGSWNPPGIAQGSKLSGIFGNDTVTSKNDMVALK